MRTDCDSPDLCQVILVYATLTEYLKRSLTRNEALSASIPSTEDLIVALLLRLGEGPWNLGRSRTAIRLIVLLERLLQRDSALLLQLRRAGRVVRCR